MKRRPFLKTLGATGAPTYLFNQPAQAAIDESALRDHRVDRVEFLSLNYHWPRLVGKNASRGIHGQKKIDRIAKIYTDQGAMGWGIGSGNDKLKSAVLGKRVSELIHPATGRLPNIPGNFDFALYDLAGIILDKPVYQLLGAKGSKDTPIYSGMIYFDELEPARNPAGIEKIIENCQWDIDYGYRQLKVKIGRGGRWYPHDEGLQKDIEVVNLIHETFKDQGIDILVDANDMYSLKDAKDFLKGVAGVPLYWFEEPFIEEKEKSQALRDYMNNNGFEKTYYADGEHKPNIENCLSLASAGTLDVAIFDINSFGFTNWISMMPKLKELTTLASPHNWGTGLKQNYSAHIAAGLGNCCTIEGVTCDSDDIDYGDYEIIDGKFRVSDKPGFGMTIKA